jgi:hypothetical protein
LKVERIPFALGPFFFTGIGCSVAGYHLRGYHFLEERIPGKAKFREYHFLEAIPVSLQGEVVLLQIGFWKVDVPSIQIVYFLPCYLR